MSGELLVDATGWLACMASTITLVVAPALLHIFVSLTFATIMYGAPCCSDSKLLKVALVPQTTGNANRSTRAWGSKSKFGRVQSMSYRRSVHIY